MSKWAELKQMTEERALPDQQNALHQLRVPHTVMPSKDGWTEWSGVRERWPTGNWPEPSTSF